ncbi:MAG: helix-hairpin-helix domain-containing protein [Bacteroidota bacterium]
MKRLRIFFKNFFGFSKTESNAAIVLLLITFLVAVLPRLYLRLAPDRERVETDSVSLLTWHQEVQSSFKPKVTATESTRSTYLTRERFSFDPNTINEKELQKLGFPAYIAQRIVKYRNAGGKFDNWEDMLRIYGIDSSLVTDLKAYVSIPPKLETPKRIVATQEESEEIVSDGGETISETLLIDINLASAEDLQEIQGIGPFYSERVVKYRNLLGGYHDLAQLNEVYGLRPEAQELLKKHTFIEDGPDKRILINSDSITLLAKHPYLSKNQARAIINYRRQHGDYDQPDDLLAIKIISDSLYQRILPYLSLDK